MSRPWSDPLQHQPSACLDRWESVYHVHKPDEEMRILGEVDPRKGLRVGIGAHAFELVSPFDGCVLVLHDSPTLALVDDNESPNVALQPVLDSIR